MRSFPGVLALAALLVALVPAAADAKKPAKSKSKTQTYRVGIASRDVSLDPDGTYAAKPVYLGGFGLGNGQVAGQTSFQYDDGRKATGNLADGLHVRAFVVSAGKHSFAIADIENQGCFVENKQGYGLMSMRKAVDRLTKGALPATSVDIQCDHSHGGPDLIGAWGGVPTEYLKHVQQQTIAAIVDAFENQRDANLVYGTAQSGLAGRHQYPEDTSDPLLTNQMQNDPVGDNDVMDDELRILQARDPKTGTPFATMLNLNAHPTVAGSSNTKATGDWPQFANTLMAQRFGGQAMTVVGTLGRQQPNRGDCTDQTIQPKGDSNPAWTLCKLQQYADRVVKRAQVALDNAQPVGGKPEVVARTYLIQDAADNAGIMSFNLAGEPIGIPIMRSTAPPWLTGTVVGSVTGSARIGDVLLSSMPGEAYPQIPLAVRAALKDSQKVKGFMTAGLSNDQLGYIIAPVPQAYPKVIVAGAGGNDNILFNMSQTLGERLTCSLLRGAGEVTGNGTKLRDASPKCGLFANDAALPPGADTTG